MALKRTMTALTRRFTTRMFQLKPAVHCLNCVVNRYGPRYSNPLTFPIRSCSTTIDDELSKKKPQKKTKKDGCFITDEALAADIVSAMNVDLEEPNTTVIELTPGYGILTKALLDAGAPRLVAFEPDIKFHQHLETLMADQNDGRLKYFTKDFMKLPRFHTFDTVSSGAESEFFPEEHDGLSIYRCIQTCRKWEEDPHIRVVGVTASNRVKEGSFLKGLHYLMASQESLFALGRPEFFIFVSSDEYDVMTMPFPPANMTRYRAPAVYYKLFFDISLLDKVPKSCFTPRIPVRVKKKTGAINDSSYLYFVRLTPKRNLFQDICPSEHLPAFMFFIQQLLYKRKWRLIPRFELWAPGFGLELIKMGFTMMQYTGEIPPEDWVRLFQAFRNSAHYNEPSFRTAFVEYSRGLVTEPSKE